MPNEVVTTPSTVTVLSWNLPGLVCTSEIDRSPIEAHAPVNAAAATIKPKTKRFDLPMAISLQIIDSTKAPRLDRESAAERRRCQRLPDSSPLGDPPRLHPCIFRA